MGSVQKITLSASRDIPFNKLVLSAANVRRIKAGVSIEELAEDIARRGLLQGLNVRPILDAAGVETGMFEIPAGGRRYRALERLVRQKRLSKTAPGRHGDLLDVIHESCGLAAFSDVLAEARRFLGMPHPEETTFPPALAGSSNAARRLFAMAQPIVGTLAETYLRHRGIKALHGTGNLRFHPRCYYRPDEHSPTETWPAMIAAVTDCDGHLTGAHRTWLARDGSSKAPIATPRWAMGGLLGHAVRFGRMDDVLAVGEGIETVLSLRCVLTTLPMGAALSAAHLAALRFPPTLRRLYILHDNDRAGDGARDRLIERAASAGIEAIALSPRLKDFNDDLRLLGIDALRACIRVQLAPEDVERFKEFRTP